MHVFWFGIEEICLTVKEFRVYLGYFESNIPVIPPLRDTMAGVLRDKLGVSNALSKFLMRGGELNTLRLIEMFMREGDPYDFVWQGKRMSALCMFLLAAYLLVSSDGRASHLFAGISAQMEERRDVVPMVLAETLIGLDAVHARQTRYLGSPLLLQVDSHSAFLFLSFPFSFYLDARVWFYVEFLTCFPLFGTNVAL